ncbi:S-layer homology domain-containing protein [Selenomonas ruminis]|uniref:S-layer protein n=1 Tax=Selenomonas ruminis TaxID=2593411 RepID=A0A5D6VXY9_9FIRM|nr:S-layer homology domain-containing protein [Selenomonas sp. mPRGC5]TYZ19535.1 S-layer protein [Selenomonas sp. mPRGC5]
MKKTLVSALTTALVVGAASTTFAAANPFSDVPADHWAYDAVAQLAQDGVITGYADSTYKGNNKITRYEMAVMVARAMAKSQNVTVSGNDKALLDKLAAEFGDELNNLGVRVANLEKNADKVKWNGKAEYDFKRTNTEGQSAAKDRHDDVNKVLFRLEPSAEVNSNWHVNARLDATVAHLERDADVDSKGEGDNGSVKLKRIWAQGDYTNFSTKLGKFAPIDDDSIFDTTFSGAEVSFGKALKLTAGAGRINNSDADADDVANYQYAGLGYDFGKLSLGADYHHLNTKSGLDYTAKDSADNHVAYSNNPNTDEANIWLAKGAYTFDKNWAVNGYYAENHDADYYKKAAAAELDYKGAQDENKGTWGAWVAYRHLGNNVDLFNTYDAIDAGQKGWEIGANYTPFKNVVAVARYGKNKDLHTDVKSDRIFGQVNFLF